MANQIGSKSSSAGSQGSVIAKLRKLSSDPLYSSSKNEIQDLSLELGCPPLARDNNSIEGSAIDLDARQSQQRQEDGALHRVNSFRISVADDANQAADCIE